MLLVWSKLCDTGYLFCHSNSPNDFIYIDQSGRKHSPLLEVAIQTRPNAIALRPNEQGCLFFCSATPMQEEDGLGEIVWDRQSPRLWERFALCAVTQYFFTDKQDYISPIDTAGFICQLLAIWSAAGLASGDNPFKTIRDLQNDSTLEKITSLFSMRLFDAARSVINTQHVSYSDNKPLDLIIATLKHDQAKLDSLCEGENFWHDYLRASDASPCRQPSQPGNAPKVVGEAFDFLSAPNFFKSRNVGLKNTNRVLSGCHLAKRTERQTYQGIGVLATFKNEGAWLIEWVAHYRLLGFDRIIIYSNDNSDGSDTLLEALAKNGIITWCNSICSDSARPQFKAYGHALNFLEEAISLEWLLIVDADEFLVLHHWQTVQDYIKSPCFAHADAIAINWRMFGTSGHQERTDGLVTERFTQAGKTYNQHVKSMFRPNKVISSGCHTPVFINSDVVYVNASGDFYPAFYLEGHNPAHAIKADGSQAQVNHYISKSEEEYLIKMGRGHGDGNTKKTLTKFGQKFSDVPDLSALKYCANISAEMQRLIRQCDLKNILLDIETNYNTTRKRVMDSNR